MYPKTIFALIRTAEKIKETLNLFQGNLIGDGYYQLSKETTNIARIMKSLNTRLTP